MEGHGEGPFCHLALSISKILGTLRGKAVSGERASRWIKARKKGIHARRAWLALIHEGLDASEARLAAIREGLGRSDARLA